MPSDVKKYEGPEMVEEALGLLAQAYIDGKTSVDAYTDEIIDLIRGDVHPHSTRPCETCRKITAMIGKPYWCIKAAMEKQ